MRFERVIVWKLKLKERVEVDKSPNFIGHISKSIGLVIKPHGDTKFGKILVYT